MVSEDPEDGSAIDVAAVTQEERERQETEEQARTESRTEQEQQETDAQRETNRQDEEARQTQEQAAQNNVQQAQAEGQAQIDAAQNKPDPRMSGSDMADAVQDIDDKTDAAIDAIDDQMQQGLGGHPGGPSAQPLPPPPDMGGGPVDTAVVQCDDKHGAGSNNPGFFTVPLGQARGTSKFTYGMITIKDQMIVTYGSVVIDTGCVSGSKTVTLPISGAQSQATVKVIPNCDNSTSKTRWSFTFYCPTP